MNWIDPTLCDEAVNLVDQDRGDHYGDPRENHRRIALAWSALLNHPVSASDVARMMVALKMVRDSITPLRDNRVDAIGYVLCLPTGEVQDDS
jgi:hypothetical protein